jgi:hypothetical protein
MLTSLHIVYPAMQSKECALRSEFLAQPAPNIASHSKGPSVHHNGSAMHVWSCYPTVYRRGWDQRDSWDTSFRNTSSGAHHPWDILHKGHTIPKHKGRTIPEKKRKKETESLPPAREGIKGTVSRDGYFFGGLIILVSTFCAWADDF